MGTWPCPCAPARDDVGVGERELGLVCWIGRAGVVQDAQVALRHPSGPDGAQAGLDRARKSGLLRRVDHPFSPHPPLHLATTAGLRACGLGRLGPAQARAPGLAHALGCVWLGLELEAEQGAAAVRYERELRVGPPAWARVGASAPGAGAAESHRPDLTLEVGARRFAVELELSRKAPARLDAILAAYATSPGLDGVRYYAPDAGVGRLVAAAARRAGADGLVEVVTWAPPTRRPA